MTYCFSYLEEMVKGWQKENVCAENIRRLPLGVHPLFNCDYYGEYIADYKDWIRQYDDYIEYLVNKYTNNGSRRLYTSKMFRLFDKNWGHKIRGFEKHYPF